MRFPGRSLPRLFRSSRCLRRPPPSRRPRCSRVVTAAAAFAAVAAAAGCGGGSSDLLLASTTSTEDSGLFDVLLPAFMAAHPEVTVRVTAVGTGQALELGRRRDADVLLVHAPPAESAFVAEGHGTARCDVMYNEFVVVGPPADPAGLAGETDAAEAFRRIAAAEAAFVSRGDDSGTYQKERALWSAAGVEPVGRWYMDVGQGMAEVLRMAVERRAYALTDRATYLSVRASTELVVVVEGDERLFNPYGVIPVTGSARAEAARAFAEWITGADAQRRIGEYGAAQFGQPLFVPDAGPCDL